MQSLFDTLEFRTQTSSMPLAVRMRPTSLDELAGQVQAVGKGTWLYNAILTDTLSSVILFGPAGTGKTSIAHIISELSGAHFVEVSAVGGTVSDLRREIAEAKKRLHTGGRTILFVDEIHRFNRAQQDALLHAVEKRELVLVGATTENPYFEVNTALLSRARVVELHALSIEHLQQIIDRALLSPCGLKGIFELDDDAAQLLCERSGGDARSALSILESAAFIAYEQYKERQKSHTVSVQRTDDKVEEKLDALQCAHDRSHNHNHTIEQTESTATVVLHGKEIAVGKSLPLRITAEHVHISKPARTLAYDKNKDMHYDVVSAFIKSMRGSDPDAALYWLACMLEGGEDPKFIARRIFILASEDIGNADPNALLIAEAAFRAVEVIGMPECRINLAQAVTYMALAPKSNACEASIDAALHEVRHGPRREVPSYLRDRHRPGSSEYGTYKYPHNYPGHWVEQRYLPEGLHVGCFYKPSESGWEAYRTDAVRRKRGMQSAREDKGEEHE